MLARLRFRVVQFMPNLFDQGVCFFIIVVGTTVASDSPAIIGAPFRMFGTAVPSVLAVIVTAFVVF